MNLVEEIKPKMANLGRLGTAAVTTRFLYRDNNLYRKNVLYRSAGTAIVYYSEPYPTIVEVEDIKPKMDFIIEDL